MLLRVNIFHHILETSVTRLVYPLCNFYDCTILHVNRYQPKYFAIEPRVKGHTAVCEVIKTTYYFESCLPFLPVHCTPFVGFTPHRYIIMPSEWSRNKQSAFILEAAQDGFLYKRK